MRFDIDDKVILRFSDDRKASSTLFRAADGEFATVVERYSQAHLPDMDFYEVELETPVSIDGNDIVLVSGLLSDELERMEAQDEGKINPKYLTKNAKAMKDEIKKHAKKDSSDSSAYNSHPNGGWKADYDKSGKPYKTKMSQHTQKFNQMFGEAFMEQISESQVDAALKSKAEKSGISKTILKKVYDRGLAAWRTGHRPGVSQHQWAMARVNSFATKGKGTWGKADKDLAQRVRKTNEAVRQDYENKKWTWDKEDENQIFEMELGYMECNTYNEPKEMPDVVKEYLNKKYPDLERLTELGLANTFSMDTIRLESAIVKYWIGPTWTNHGLGEPEIAVLNARLRFTLSIWNDDKDGEEIEWEYELEDAAGFTEVARSYRSVGKIKLVLNTGYPIELSSVDIDMNQTWDSNQFKYEFTFGQ